MNTRHLKAALAYAAHGWRVFPIKPGAKSPPLIKEWQIHATTDPQIVKRWWWENPAANIGIATGEASGLVVLDLDGPEGKEWWLAWCRAHGLVRTLWQRTGRLEGGMQLLFGHPGEPCPNRTDIAGSRSGVDVRGDGGYILVPPSAHPSGRRYRWIGREPVASMPADLVEDLYQQRQETPQRTRAPRDSPSSAYADAALQREYEAVACEGGGSRNDRLNVAAYNLGQLVGAGLLRESLVVESLREAAVAAGLADDPGCRMSGINRTISSGLRAGMANPRQVARN